MDLHPPSDVRARLEWRRVLFVLLACTHGVHALHGPAGQTWQVGR